MSRKTWIIGNVFIGVGSIISFLYILFGLFWSHPQLMPWYLGLVILIFVTFNYFAIKQHKLIVWGAALLIMFASAITAYLLHGIFVLNVFQI